MKIHLAEPITIDSPMVIIPAEEYEFLLKEAGYAPTPKLDQRISQARTRYRKKKYLAWDKIKHDLV